MLLCAVQKIILTFFLILRVIKINKNFPAREFYRVCSNEEKLIILVHLCTLEAHSE